MLNGNGLFGDKAGGHRAAMGGFRHEYLTTQAIEKAQSLIAEFDLHWQPARPVDLRPLFEYIHLMELDLPPTTFGFTLDQGQEIIVALNNKLDWPMLRATAMHEIGHISMLHENQLHALQAGRWWYDRMEIEATTVAAMVLIPRQAVEQPLTSFEVARQLAALYVVPFELVLVRYAIYQSQSQ